MKNEAIAPTIEKDRVGQCDPHDVLKHPAFGTVVLTHPTGRGTALFGSDVGHMGCVRIEVTHAELHRNLSRDWIFPRDTVVAFEMTHSQFAAFITGAGRGEGTPVTLIRAPATPALAVSPILSVETKHDTFRREIREASASRLAHMLTEVERLEELIDSGKASKKLLKDITANLRRHVEQAPGTMEFVVKSAEEALETATDNARIEVEAFIDAKTRALGLSSLAQLADLAPLDAHPALKSSSEVI